MGAQAAFTSSEPGAGGRARLFEGGRAASRRGAPTTRGGGLCATARCCRVTAGAPTGLRGLRRAPEWWTFAARSWLARGREAEYRDCAEGALAKACGRRGRASERRARDRRGGGLCGRVPRGGPRLESSGSKRARVARLLPFERSPGPWRAVRARRSGPLPAAGAARVREHRRPARAASLRADAARPGRAHGEIPARGEQGHLPMVPGWERPPLQHSAERSKPKSGDHDHLSSV